MTNIHLLISQANPIPGLESSVRAFSSQVKDTERKLAVSDTTLRNVTKERDSAVSQLGVAYFTIEQLKSENVRLANENGDLKAKLGLTTNNLEQDDAIRDRKQAKPVHADRYQPSERRTAIGASTIGEHRPVEASDRSYKRQDKQLSKARTARIQFQDHLASRNEAEKSQTRKQVGSPSKASAQYDSNRLSRHQSHITDPFPPTEQTGRSVDYAESESSQESDIERPEQSTSQNIRNHSSQHRDDQIPNTTRDITYLSFLEVKNYPLTVRLAKLTTLCRVMTSPT